MVLLAVTLSHLDPLPGFEVGRLPQIARHVEDSGADQVVLSEHVTLGVGPIEGDGPSGAMFPFPPTELYPEPLIALAMIGAATTTARLCTNVLIGPLRPAVLLAKSAATVDAMTGGRLELGLGSGWYEREFEALGAPFRRRGVVLEEQIRACQLLWSGSPSSFAGETVSFHEMVCSPAPVQPGGVKIWLAGGAAERTARRVARLAGGWTVIGSTPIAEIAAGVALLHRACAEVDRDAGEIGVRCTLPVGRDGAGRPDLTATLTAAHGFVDAGATVIQLPALTSFVREIDEIPAVVEQAASAIHSLR
jgi:probable F420-dependent oxidoreductase